jgi:xanthine/uracil/vitamin C permease (AzgA family)
LLISCLPTAGIGTFLAFIGLQQSEGIGFITFDPATLVTLGGCPPDQRSHMYSISDGKQQYKSDTGVAKRHCTLCIFNA